MAVALAKHGCIHPGVPLSYQERRIYNHHEQIDRTIGAERLPASLRIPQVLEPYWRT